MGGDARPWPQVWLPGREGRMKDAALPPENVATWGNFEGSGGWQPRRGEVGAGVPKCRAPLGSPGAGGGYLAFRVGAGKSRNGARSALPINYTCFSQKGCRRVKSPRTPAKPPGRFPPPRGRARRKAPGGRGEGPGQPLTAPAPEIAAGLVLEKKGVGNLALASPGWEDQSR